MRMAGMARRLVRAALPTLRRTGRPDPAGADPMTAKRTPEEQATIHAIEALLQQLGDHKYHPWSKVGFCVWCDTCHVRLYQGSPFTDAEKADLPEPTNSP
jgi:hypothetical protein